MTGRESLYISKFCTKVKLNHGCTRNSSRNVCNMKWESTIIIRFFQWASHFFAATMFWILILLILSVSYRYQITLSSCYFLTMESASTYVIHTITVKTAIFCCISWMISANCLMLKLLCAVDHIHVLHCTTRVKPECWSQDQEWLLLVHLHTHLGIFCICLCSMHPFINISLLNWRKWYVGVH